MRVANHAGPGSMNILILGGTVFLGRHLVQAALARGHALTLFNRGQHGATLFEGSVEKLCGDRDADLAALRGRSFDCVVDCCGYRPQQVRDVVAALGGATPHYIFVSSISVYRSFAPGQSFDEDAPLLQGDDGYGALKARCEQTLQELMPGQAALVRPGLIVGPFDPTGRFTYWPRRIARGGQVLAPGRPERPVQWIDVRDLAQWCVHLAEQRTLGPFNAVGPRLAMRTLLERCIAVAGSAAQLTWQSDAALLAAGVSPWTELPLWIPEDDPAFGGMLLADNARALAHGLKARPVDDTIAATLQWDQADPAASAVSGGAVATMTPERETQLLADAAAPVQVRSTA